ncbi:MAG: hypothetical protein LBI03_02170 [Clostridiales bacterium]|jgi:hypothetical protein|nr:hypothetical protein [Clostridiales bacterium]
MTKAKLFKTRFALASGSKRYMTDWGMISGYDFNTQDVTLTLFSQMKNKIMSLKT